MKLRKKFPGCYQVAGWYVLRSVYGDKKIFLNVEDFKNGWWGVSVRELDTGQELQVLSEARTRRSVLECLPEDLQRHGIEAITFEEYYGLSR
jgi:hypothetical protein